MAAKEQSVANRHGECSCSGGGHAGADVQPADRLTDLWAVPCNQYMTSGGSHVNSNVCRVSSQQQMRLDLRRTSPRHQPLL